TRRVPATWPKTSTAVPDADAYPKGPNDTSAITRMVQPEVAARLSPPVEAGHVATCAVVDLDLYAHIGDPSQLGDIRVLRAASFHWLTTTDDDLGRALDGQAALATEGHTIGWTALAVAAIAERHRVTVLHHNADFDHVAKVTGQATEWVVAEGGPLS